MELLFKRQQTPGKVGRVAFKLWAKIEFNEDETALVKRYRLDEAILIHEETPNLIRNAGLLGLAAAIIVYLLLGTFLPDAIAAILALGAWGGVAYWWVNEKRETIFVRDLMHGRYFSCPSIIELSKKEVHLTSLSDVVRQVMESAKHWDGTERHTIEPLPKEEARALVASL